MSKSIEELATELTIAYLQQGQIHISDVQACEAYEKFFTTIKEQLQNSYSEVNDMI